MVVDVALYTAVHQPRRLKLPAQPIPRCASIEDITRCLFDERLNERYFHHAAQTCYYPAARMFLELVRRHGLRLALSISLSFVRQAMLWEPALLDLFRELVAEEHVELIGVEPYRSLHGLIDLPGFVSRLRWMADEMVRIFGKRPVIADLGELGISTSLYNVLDAADFKGTLMEPGPQVMEWRSSNYLYLPTAGFTDVVDARMSAWFHYCDASTSEGECQKLSDVSETSDEGRPYLLAHHPGLSSDISERFSNHAWTGFPLYANSYASWIEQAEGDFVLLGLDIEVFGERHVHESGIFEFMQALPGELEQRGIVTRTPSELIDRFASARAYDLPLPIRSTNWSAAYQHSYFEHEQQQALFQAMQDVYNLARLTENPELIDLAIWLMQSDNMRLVYWPGPQIATATVPHEWWRLGPSGLLYEQQQVYRHALYALEPYLPVRTRRQTVRKSSPAYEHASELNEAQKSKETREPEKPVKTGVPDAAGAAKGFKGGAGATARKSSTRTKASNPVVSNS